MKLRIMFYGYRSVAAELAWIWAQLQMIQEHESDC
jgi:hypothetical protein